MNAKIISKIIDRHASPATTPKLEAHSLASLSQRVLAPKGVTTQFLEAGILRAAGKPSWGDGKVLLFKSDHLDEVRRTVLTELACKTIEGVQTEDPRQIELAVSGSLHSHVRKCESRQNVTELAYRDEEQQKPSLISRVGEAAALVGGAAYLRGSLGISGRKANQLGTARVGLLGGRLLVKDARNALGTAKGFLKKQFPAQSGGSQILTAALKRARAAV